MSTLAPRAPLAPSPSTLPAPTPAATRPRRTLLGFVGTRRTVEIILTIILGVGGGLLLYAWGWSVVATIALYAGIAALIGFVIMLLVTIGDFIADPKIAAHQLATA